MEQTNQKYFTEMKKLIKGLNEKDIDYELFARYDGFILVVKNDYASWDVICHQYSYGHEQGLLELAGDICHKDVEGWLNAAEILNRL